MTQNNRSFRYESLNKKRAVTYGASIGHNKSRNTTQLNEGQRIVIKAKRTIKTVHFIKYEVVVLEAKRAQRGEEQLE